MMGQTTAVLKNDEMSICGERERGNYLSFFTSNKRYSNQPGEHSTCASRNVNVSPLAISAPIREELRFFFDSLLWSDLSVEISLSLSVRYCGEFPLSPAVLWRMFPMILWGILERWKKFILCSLHRRRLSTSINTGIIDKNDFLDEFSGTSRDNAGQCS